MHPASRTLCLMLAGFLLLQAPPLRAQPQPGKDLLEEVKQRRAVEAQRIEQAVRQADRDAAEVGRTSPSKAILILREALAILAADTALDEGTRAGLRRSIELSLRAYEGRAADRTQGSAEDFAARLARVEAQGREQEQQQRMQADISRTMQQIRALESAGRRAEARSLSMELARRYPGSRVVGAGGSISRANDILADSRDLRRLRSDRMLEVDRSILKSAANITDDITFPDDWAEKSKRRSPALQMTATERKILRALAAPVSVDFDNQTFGNVIEYLEKLIGEPIVVHRDALAEVGVTYDSSVNLRTPNKVALRSVLKKVLAELGLTYIIKDQAIQVTTVARARETLTTRVYYVGDLVQATNLQMGFWVSQAQTLQAINSIATAIQQTIDPPSWEINGGPARISFDPLSMSFVIRQSAEVHMMLGTALR